jgi:hypothetical protein
VMVVVVAVMIMVVAGIVAMVMMMVGLAGLPVGHGLGGLSASAVVAHGALLLIHVYGQDPEVPPLFDVHQTLAAIGAHGNEVIDRNLVPTLHAGPLAGHFHDDQAGIFRARRTFARDFETELERRDLDPGEQADFHFDGVDHAGPRSRGFAAGNVEDPSHQRHLMHG